MRRKKPRDVWSYAYSVVKCTYPYSPANMDRFVYPMRKVWAGHRKYRMTVLVPGKTWMFTTKDGAVFLLHLKDRSSTERPEGS